MSRTMVLVELDGDVARFSVRRFNESPIELIAIGRTGRVEDADGADVDALDDARDGRTLVELARIVCRR